MHKPMTAVVKTRPQRDQEQLYKPYLPNVFNDNGNDGEICMTPMNIRGDKAKSCTDTIMNFFARVPQESWFELDGFPMVVLYSSFGAPHERDLLEKVDDRFWAKYKKRLYFIAEESWKVRCHARYRWGSALNGPTGDSVVKTLGPGYNDTPVPGRGTPIRDREDTRFYQWSWHEVLLGSPTIVLIETWNEFHEGSGIAPCAEHGDRYVSLTRRYIKRLKRGILPDIENPVRLAHPAPLPRPDTGWFQADASTAEVHLYAAALDKHHRGHGLRLSQQPDGAFRRSKSGREITIETVTTPGATSYLYLGVADEFAFRQLSSFELEIEISGGRPSVVELQYDSWDHFAPLKGAYRPAPKHRFRDGLLERKTLVWSLPDARFANRQNGAADLRLAIRGAPIHVHSIKLRRVGDRREGRPTLTLK